MKKIFSRIYIILLAVFEIFSVAAFAEDVDVYRAFVKNNAMILLDTSGSMSWPVYDNTMDYAGFMHWMIGRSLAIDDDDCRDGSSWWDRDGSGNDYDKLDPDEIYLVSTYVNFSVIDYTDSSGTPRHISVIDDIMWNTGSESSTSSNKRRPFLYNAIIPAMNTVGSAWTLDDTTTIDTNSGGHVLFPRGITEDIDGNSVTVPSAIEGKLLPNYRDIALSETVTDSNTHEATDVGFVGALNSGGFYFSGTFEKSGSGLEFTDSNSSAEYNSGYRVYVFATGKLLNMLKLVEDFKVASPYRSCSNALPNTYSATQTHAAWRSICYKESATDPTWTMGRITITSHNTEYSDYPDTSTGNDLRGAIDPPGTGVSQIKIKFSYIDTDGCKSGTANDYVDLQDIAGNSLLCIKGQEIGAGTAGSGAAVSHDGGATWTSSIPLDTIGYTEAISAGSIKVVWHNGSKKSCSGADRGFKITGYKYTDQAAGTPGDFTCCNGSDGYGIKMKSRMDVARNAMKRVIQETRDKITWGLTKFNGGDGGTVLESLGADPDGIIDAIVDIDAGGSTPLGESIQDAYDDDYNYLKSHSSLSSCSNNYIVAVTDGFPGSDTEWSRIINDTTAASYPTPTFGYCSSGYGGCSSTYGDADNWPGSNYSDDVAYWLYHEATYKHMVHCIGFGLNNPMLGDVADSSNGRYLTAYNEQGLINAFYSLGLSMSSSVTFTAPAVSMDQASQTQNGDSLYIAFFKPEEEEWWKGNLKRYGMSYMQRTDCSRTQNEWVVVDKNGLAAGDCDGRFKSGSVSFWSSTPDSGEVAEGGAGAVLKAAMPDITTASPDYYGFRNIYTCKDGSNLIRFYRDDDSTTTDTIDAVDLGVTNNPDRDKIINYIYGYTYDAHDSDSDPTTYDEVNDGAPSAKRDWILGDMIHSEPSVIEYFDENYILKHRLIAIGANDGMLHVFVDDFDSTTTEDTTINGTDYSGGGEIWAFIPGDLLPELKNFSDQTTHRYFVDGFVTIYRARTWSDVSSPGNTTGVRDNGEYFKKTMVFGERRGGRSYWALDVTNPHPSKWRVKWHALGGSGDYTELGYSWAKPGYACIRTGSSTMTDVVVFTGGYDSMEDNFPEPWQDDNGNGIKDTGETYTDQTGGTTGSYDRYNPTKDNMGRAIYVVNLSDGSLLFRAAYGASDDTTGDDQTYSSMKWCFPADPTVIDLMDGTLHIYASDVYGTIWKVTYDYNRTRQWEVSRVFSANPGSDQPSARTAITAVPALNHSDTGRKSFYSPDVSFYGSDWTNYPVLFFGTGDRAHPRYIPYKANRIYSFSDSGSEADETNLINLTCDELDKNADVDLDGTLENSSKGDDYVQKNQILDILFGDTPYPDSTGSELCRGWYKTLSSQTSCTQDTYDHSGEMVLSRPSLFYGTLYFTTYSPLFGDPCNPSGNSHVYALDYSDGSAALDLNQSNTITLDGTTSGTVEDTYYVIKNSSIPSGVRIITRQSHAAAIVSEGGSIVGAGEVGEVSTGSGAPPPQGHSSDIPGPPGGVQQIMWQTY